MLSCQAEARYFYALRFVYAMLLLPCRGADRLMPLPCRHDDAACKIFADVAFDVYGARRRRVMRDGCHDARRYALLVTTMLRLF